MDTNFAATVIAVIEEGSIAGAARQLALTPGAVALRIKMVEAELGATLIGVDPSTYSPPYSES